MTTCNTCGGDNFYKEDGYLYCCECQTQSQGYYELDSGMAGLSSQTKSKVQRKKRGVEQLETGDLWTSWDSFNYILFGMTEELQNLSFASKGLKDIILQLWACQLQKSEVAFTSRTNEKRPKLGFLYRHRDSKMIYGFTKLIQKKKRKRKKTLPKSRNKSIEKMKKQFFAEHLEECSRSQLSTEYLSDSIETLTPTSSRSASASESEGSRPGCLRNIFAQSDNLTYSKYKYLTRSSTLKHSRRVNLSYFCKSKLLAIIHLALLLSGSAIQLGDVLRFIRECHLSFAKVTQFLPEDYKLSRGDICFIETVRDNNMPTHLKQRKVGGTLARSLGINEISLPDMFALVNRYCVELNLPSKIVRYSLTVLKQLDIEKMCILKRIKYLPNFEALAMACIMFVMKLLFGLDGITELILSDLAEKINSVRLGTDEKLFVFKDWQRHIECRKALLQNLHYPTEEKLKSSLSGKSKGYIDTLIKESKDEGREERFRKYDQYYVDPKIVNSVKDVLESLKEPMNDGCWDFPPSLTPYSTYIDIILQVYREEKEKKRLNRKALPKLSPVTLSILNEKYKEQSIDYVIRPRMYEKLLTDENFRIIEKSKSDLINIKLTSEITEDVGTETECEKIFERIKFPQFSKSKNVVFIKNPFDYWILRHTSREETVLYEFKSDAFSKMPVNFRWFLVECSAMLEMNTRELYKELMFVENRMRVFVKNIKNSRIRRDPSPSESSP